MDDKIPCRTPNPDKPGITNLPAWKFNAIRKAILEILGEQGDVRWSDLTELVRTKLTKDERDNMGSVGWHTVSVKLEMEVRGEIKRRDQKGPQVIGLP